MFSEKFLLYFVTVCQLFVASFTYDIVLQSPEISSNSANDAAALGLLDETMIPLNGNVSCYCNPENTTVACNDTDVQPLQESSLIPDNAQFLYISSNRISYDHIGQGNFSRTLNITEIILRNCGVAEILPASFRPLKSLKHFELADNARPVILRDDAFAGADLDTVFLHKLTGGLQLTSNSFREALIRTLVLVLCRLGEVPHLGHASLGESLTTLYLSQNHIREIKGWSFAGLRSLKRIYLDNNSIKDILPNAFAGVELDLLDLSRNPGLRLHRSSFVGARIKKLLLSDCRIAKLDFGLLAPMADTLQELDLSGNGLLEVSSATFAGLTNLRQLDLSNNSKLIVQPKSFAFSSVINRIDLSDCPNLQFVKGSFCKAQVEELLLGRSAGSIDFNNPQPLIPLLAPQQPADSTKMSNMKILDVSQNGVRLLAKSEFWKLALANVQDEVRLAGNPISCSDPQTAVMISRFKEKLVDICSDLRKYALLMPQMHSELSFNEKWLASTLDDECREVNALEAARAADGRAVEFELENGDLAIGLDKQVLESSLAKPALSQQKKSVNSAETQLAIRSSILIIPVIALVYLMAE